MFGKVHCVREVKAIWHLTVKQIHSLLFGYRMELRVIESSINFATSILLIHNRDRENVKSNFSKVLFSSLLSPEHRVAGGRHTWSASHLMRWPGHGVTEHSARASSSPSGQSLAPSQTCNMRGYKLDFNMIIMSAQVPIVSEGIGLDNKVVV